MCVILANFLKSLTQTKKEKKNSFCNFWKLMFRENARSLNRDGVKSLKQIVCSKVV